jgi:hypothetical protein
VRNASSYWIATGGGVSPAHACGGRQPRTPRFVLARPVVLFNGSLQGPGAYTTGSGQYSYIGSGHLARFLFHLKGETLHEKTLGPFGPVGPTRTTWSKTNTIFSEISFKEFSSHDFASLFPRDLCCKIM